jgi:hypothetical protein
MPKNLLGVHHELLSLHRQNKGIEKHDNEITTRK